MDESKATADGRKLHKTGTPGVYRRDGGGYVVTVRVAGKQRKRTAKTLDEGRRLKRALEADRDRGDLHSASTITLRAYLREWIDRYHGTGRRGFREHTRAEYRRLLDRFAHEHFPERLRLTEVTPRHLSRFVAWLADDDAQRRPLADSTIRNATVPVRAALATATREGLLRHNPAANLALPIREQVREDDAEVVRALDRSQLAGLLALVHPRHRLLVELIASTGLRISEAIALERRDLALDGPRPHLKVRRAIVKGVVGPPKTKHGRRTVPIPRGLVAALRSHLADRPDTPDALVFASGAGTRWTPTTSATASSSP